MTPSTTCASHRRLPLVPVLALAVLGLLLAATPAAAQVDFGVRGGLSVDPDQAYVGLHAETGPLVERLRFRPNAEVGLGEDLTLVGLNLEFVWKFRRARSGWGIYAGGGPAINVFFLDRGRFGDDNTEMEPGMNFLVGLEHDEGLFFEFKLGALDSPDLKIGVGYTWR